METKKTIKLPVSGEEITFNAPTVGVVRDALRNIKDKTELDIGAILTAKCCNMTEEKLNTYDFRDFMALGKVMKDFLGEAGMSELMQ
jgi:hypothetical protein